MILPDRVQPLVGSFSGRRLLVIGDVILDRYVWGAVDRISPEAPVPVVQVTRESIMPGGAGNVARNVAALGGQVELIAAVGEDDTGRELTRLLSEWKIDTTGLVAETGRPTTVKTRVIARAQQVVRFDRESEEVLTPPSTIQLLETIRARIDRVDGVILEDYGKGILSNSVLEVIMQVCADRNRPVFVDPKAEHWALYRGAELVKPNLREAEQVTGIRARGDEDLTRLGRAVLDATGARTVAITRGERGMTLFYADGGLDNVPTVAHAVADATGAGDTAIAALALARLAGASWTEAASLANSAAGVVVQVPGTASLGPDELIRVATEVSGAEEGGA
jgi:D-beta-D-heptose 7-phosphate kinase/D-beta-D-heptose 1-phosphate adenosyltransferase